MPTSSVNSSTARWGIERVIVEVATFKLADGTDEAAFLAADKAVQEELVPRRPGFVRRTTARGNDGAWLVVALWRTMADAEATADLAHGHPAGQAFAGCLDQSTVEIRRYETID